jgi:hypothetical protein
MIGFSEKALQIAMMFICPVYPNYGVFESSDLPGSNVGISLGDLMNEYGVPADSSWLLTFAVGDDRRNCLGLANNSNRLSIM